MPNTLQTRIMQHTRPPCPSPTPGVYSNSYPSSRWYHPIISSSVVSFSSYLQSFPASGSFQMSQFFTSGGQSNGASASASVLPINIQDWFPLGWTGWISLLFKGLSRVFSNTIVQKHSTFFIVQLSHPYMTAGKTIALTRWTFPLPVVPVFLPYTTIRHKATWGTADPSLHIWEQKSCLSLDIVLVVIVPSRTKSIICSLWLQMQCVCACMCMWQFCCCTRILDYES